VEPKVDGVRGLVVFQPDGSLEMRNRRGIRRDWLRGDRFEAGLRHLGDVLPLLWRDTVIDGELTAGRFQWTMAALLGSRRYRERLELLSRAFDVPYELSPLVEPSRALAEQMADGRLEGIVLKDRSSAYRDGSRRGWSKVKDPSWQEREAWRFDRRR
jgi:ATP-dependent DNA ligase